MTIQLLHKEDGHVWGAYIPMLLPRGTMVEMLIDQLDLDPGGISKDDIDYKRIKTEETEDGTTHLVIGDGDEGYGVYSTVWIAE